MDANQRIRVLLQLMGGPEYSSELRAASASTRTLGRDTRAVGAAMTDTARRTFVQNQALYTLRRYSFYATTALIGLIGYVGKLGFSYLSTMQTARVALQPVFKSTGALTDELGKLYQIAALSPFLFKDTVNAFRMMYAGMHPVGVSADTINKSLQAIMDTLAFTGKASPGALNRISTQLQHMANIGHLTGQTFQALARDGLQLGPALTKSLGIPKSELASIAKLNLPAGKVLKAIIDYANNTRGIKGAAMRLSNSTLSGAFAQLKDLLSQAAGRAETGLFGGLTHMLAGVNNQLAPLLKANKPITLYAIINAFDNQLTPGTHMLINAFTTLDTGIRVLFTDFGVLFKAVSLVLWPFDQIFNLFGVNHAAATALGIVLGTLAFLWTLQKIRMLAMAETSAIAAAAQTSLNLAMGEGAIASLTSGIAGMLAYAFATEQVFVGLARADAAAGIWTEEQYINNGVMAKGIRLTKLAALATWGLTKSVWVATTAFIAEKWAALSAWAAALGGTTLIVVAILAIVAALILAIKYWKELRHWAGTSAGSATGLGSPTPGHPVNQSAAAHVGMQVNRATGWIPGLSWLSRHFHPAFAAGGTMPHSGVALVGERGPELVNLPGGSRVFPNHQLGDALGGGTKFELHQTIHPQPIYLDGTKLTEVISTIVTDREARL